MRYLNIFIIEISLDICREIELNISRNEPFNIANRRNFLKTDFLFSGFHRYIEYTF